MAGYGLATLPDTSSQRHPPPGPPQENYGNPPLANQPPHLVHPPNQYTRPPAMIHPPAAQPAPNPVSGGPVQNDPMRTIIGQPTFNTGKAAFNPAQPVYNARQPFNSGQPSGQPVETYDGGQTVKANRAMAAAAGVVEDQEVMQYPTPAPPPQLPPRTDIRPAAKPEPDVPSFSEGDAKSDHGLYTILSSSVGRTLSPSRPCLFHSWVSGQCYQCWQV